MLELKVRKFGKALGVLLPKELIERLNLVAGDSLLLTESSEGTFELAPSNAEHQRQMNIAEGIMVRYRHTLRALAK
jgi:putative addiction module antidote